MFSIPLKFYVNVTLHEIWIQNFFMRRIFSTIVKVIKRLRCSGDRDYHYFHSNHHFNKVKIEQSSQQCLIIRSFTYQDKKRHFIMQLLVKLRMRRCSCTYTFHCGPNINHSSFEENWSLIQDFLYIITGCKCNKSKSMTSQSVRKLG